MDDFLEINMIERLDLVQQIAFVVVFVQLNRQILSAAATVTVICVCGEVQ